MSILRGKLAREQLTANVDALVAASGILRKKRGTDAHFGNGGAVANLLSEAKLRKERRRGSDGSIASRQVYMALLEHRLPNPPFSYGLLASLEFSGFDSSSRNVHRHRC